MNLRNSHTLISAYVALATVAAGLLTYDALRPKPTEPPVGVLTIEPVTATHPTRIASRIAPSDHQVQ